jgi:hypothetical protein
LHVRDGGKPARTEDVGRGQQARNQVFVRDVRSGDEGAVSQGTAAHLLVGRGSSRPPHEWAYPLRRRRVRCSTSVRDECALGPGRLGQNHSRAGHRNPRDTIDRLRGVGVREECDRDQVAVHVQRVQVHVREGIARQVIARIELCSDCAAPDCLLLRGLDLLGPREKTAGGDAGLDERLIVARPSKALSSYGSPTNV